MHNIMYNRPWNAGSGARDDRGGDAVCTRGVRRGWYVVSVRLWLLVALVLPGWAAGAQQSSPPQQPAPAAPPTVAVNTAFEGFVRFVGAETIGPPISPVMERDGMRMQYFERVRLDLPPGKPVELARAGATLAIGLETAPVSPPPLTDARFRYFPETGHTLANSFRAFWEGRNGADLFGLPVTEEMPERDLASGKTRTVQYFERVRLEWFPELATGTPNTPDPTGVRLGAIGRPFWQFAEGPRLPDAPPGPVRGLASPRSPAFGLVVEFQNQPHVQLIGTVGELGARWVRQPVQWQGLEPSPGVYDFAPLNVIVEDLRIKGVNILFTVSGSPAWASSDGPNSAPRDPADFARFMGALVTRFKGRVAAYEVWNEPNLAFEWGRRVDAGAYVEMLKVVAPAIRVADPAALVVAAGLGPTGVLDPALGVDDVRYLEQLYAYQGGVYKTLADVQGSHPYGYRSAPDLLPPDKPNTGPYTNHPSFYFRRIEQQRLAMIRAGDGDRAMWITEWGFGAGDYVEFADVSETTRTQWTLESVAIIRARYPWVGAMFLWNLNWSVFTPAGSPGYYSLLNKDYNPRPVYYAVRAMPK